MERQQGQSKSRQVHLSLGVDWTTPKLDLLAKYLAGFLVALKGRPSKESPVPNGLWGGNNRRRSRACTREGPGTRCRSTPQ
jgi:hypothetical protein